MVSASKLLFLKVMIFVAIVYSSGSCRLVLVNLLIYSNRDVSNTLKPQR